VGDFNGIIESAPGNGDRSIKPTLNLQWRMKIHVDDCFSCVDLVEGESVNKCRKAKTPPTLTTWCEFESGLRGVARALFTAIVLAALF
jgi:hypothetical protein